MFIIFYVIIGFPIFGIDSNAFAFCPTDMKVYFSISSAKSSFSKHNKHKVVPCDCEASLAS